MAVLPACHVGGHGERNPHFQGFHEVKIEAMANKNVKFSSRSKKN